MTAPTHGQIAYEAGGGGVYGFSDRRQRLPWEDVGDPSRDGWEAAGQAVAGPLEAELERLSALVAAPPQQALDIAWNALQHIALHADDKSAAKARATLRAINEFLEDGTTEDGNDRTPRPAVSAPVYLATIAHLAAALRDIRDANPAAPAGAYTHDRAVLALGTLPPGIPPGFAGVDWLYAAIDATTTETTTEGKS